MTILAAVVVNLIMNHVKQYKNSSENNIQKLITDINSIDRTQNKIQSEVTDMEINKISDDALNTIYLMYGSGLIDEDKFLRELESGVKRAKKVYEAAKDRCKECKDYVRESMLLAKFFLIKQWENNKKDTEQRINKAKEGGKIKELGLKNEYLKEGVKWFTEKHSCLDIKQESGNLSEILKNK